MKKMIILSCLILFFTPMVWAQERCEAPTLNIGDKWIYTDKSGGKWSQEVVAIENDIYVIRIGKRTFGYDKNTMTLNFIIDENNRKTKYTSTRGKILNFPLYVGKKWPGIGRYEAKKGGQAARERDFQEEHFVSSYEDVKVMAGTFKAFKIEYRQQNMETMRESAKGAYWYSPEIKAFVKRVEWVTIEIAGDMELVSYNLKQ